MIAVPPPPRVIRTTPRASNGRDWASILPEDVASLEPFIASSNIYALTDPDPAGHVFFLVTDERTPEITLLDGRRFTGASAHEAFECAFEECYASGMLPSY